MELCLGTVQFGLDYGIIGQKKPSMDYAVSCLDYAAQNGITAIDTAAAYGNAEEVVGTFLAQKTILRDKLFISTKLRPNSLDDIEEKELKNTIREHLCHSLKILHTEYVDAYLLHSARYTFRPDILEALYAVKKEGLAREVGVSVYEPDEAMACLEDEHIGFLQLPFSIFDHRMEHAGIFEEAIRHRCQIHVRSAFIQGLITLPEEKVPPFLKAARPILNRMDALCKEAGISRIELALAYVKKTKGISHLVFGVDSLEQLKEDITLFRNEVPGGVLERIKQEFDQIPAEIMMPSLWKK